MQPSAVEVMQCNQNYDVILRDINTRTHQEMR